MARKTEIAGWLLFILSALGYSIDSLRSGDLVSLAASLFFLLACIVFLIPILRAGRSD